MYKQIFGFPQYTPISKQHSIKILNFVFETKEKEIKNYYKDLDVEKIIKLNNPFNSAFNGKEELMLCFYLNYIFNMKKEVKEFDIINDGRIVVSNIINCFLSPCSRTYYNETRAKFNANNNLCNSNQTNINSFLFINMTIMKSINFNVIKWLFENEDYSTKNTTIENRILRRCIFPFYFFWDFCNKYTRYELLKKIKINKINHAQYYFYKICDSKMFEDVGDKMFTLLKKEKLLDLQFTFSK